MQQLCRSLASQLQHVHVFRQQQLVSLAEFAACSSNAGMQTACASVRQQSIQKAAIASFSGTAAASTLRSSAACRASTATFRGSAACCSHVQDAAMAAMWQAGTSHGTLVSRGFATRTLQPRRTGTGGWQDNPNHQALYLIAFTVGMVGITYAAVPLYRMFCQATGYGGTVVEGKTVEDKIRARQENPDAATEEAAAARELTVTFNADVNDGMPWRFLPSQRAVKIRPGQSTLAFFTAENTSNRVITGVSTYNVTPQQAGTYFNKIQCFCFEEQKLRPGEKIDMPVFFYVDPEFATDPRMKRVNHLTLSYTFFKVLEEDVEDVPYEGPAVANLCEGDVAAAATA